MTPACSSMRCTACPTRAHGYCVDDNARALLVACMLNMPGEQRLPDVLTARLAAFVQHAWNPDSGRFRNFMSFDRRWLEDRGSEDSHGRTLWALGECARGDASQTRRNWALALFAQAVRAVEHFHSPRAWAFTAAWAGWILCRGPGGFRGPADADSARRPVVDTSFEYRDAGLGLVRGGTLSYDNARLPQALICTGLTTGVAAYVVAGLRSLRWLMTLQTSDSDFFRPVGSESFGDTRRQPRAFDQQPLEATAAVSACLVAWRADGDPKWKADAARACLRGSPGGTTCLRA